jgi:hypothetical protein
MITYTWQDVGDENDKILTQEEKQKIADKWNANEAAYAAKIQEIKDAETAKANNKASGKAKLKTGEALTDAEVEALFG